MSKNINVGDIILLHDEILIIGETDKNFIFMHKDEFVGEYPKDLFCDIDKNYFKIYDSKLDKINSEIPELWIVQKSCLSYSDNTKKDFQGRTHWFSIPVYFNQALKIANNFNKRNPNNLEVNDVGLTIKNGRFHDLNTVNISIKSWTDEFLCIQKKISNHKIRRYLYKISKK